MPIIGSAMLYDVTNLQCIARLLTFNICSLLYQVLVRESVAMGGIIMYQCLSLSLVKDTFFKKKVLLYIASSLKSTQSSKYLAHARFTH